MGFKDTKTKKPAPDPNSPYTAVLRTTPALIADTVAELDATLREQRGPQQSAASTTGLQGTGAPQAGAAGASAQAGTDAMENTLYGDAVARAQIIANATIDGITALEELVGSTVDVGAYTQTPASPASFQGIRTGPEFQIQHEANQAPQIDSTDPLLRSLSPFMLRVEVPAVFAKRGLDAKPQNQIDVGAYTTGGAFSDRYVEARNALANLTLGSPDGSSAPVTPALAAPSSATGKNPEPAITDFATAQDIKQQLQAFISAPPLVLLINPATMSMNYTKLQQFSDRSRFGYLFHSHGEEQPRLSISARCGAFYSGGRGVRFSSKMDSQAWQNLMGAFTFYKSNGYIYDTLGKSNAHHFVGALSIHYDQWIYYGHMESFEWAYEETNQNGGLTFSLEFVVSAMTDTAAAPINVLPMKSPNPNPADPRYGVRGIYEDVGNILSAAAEGVAALRGPPTGFRSSPTASERPVAVSSSVKPFGF